MYAGLSQVVVDLPPTVKGVLRQHLRRGEQYQHHAKLH
jgi:hypothetical protein